MLVLIFLFSTSFLFSQKYLVDVGDRVLKIQITNEDTNDSQMLYQLFSAINAATEVGLLKWENKTGQEVQSDTISPFAFKTLTLGGFPKNYWPNKGEIMVYDGESYYVTKPNVEFVMFLKRFYLNIE
jgi:hypothetical protein